MQPLHAPVFHHVRQNTSCIWNIIESKRTLIGAYVQNVHVYYISEFDLRHPDVLIYEVSACYFDVILQERSLILADWLIFVYE